MTTFVPGLELARDFYRDVVRALVKVPHSACLLGEGSEVLGYDSPRSTDHEWGPRLQLFVAAEEISPVQEIIARGLPAEYRGYPTAWFSLTEQCVTHHIEISTLHGWLVQHFGIDPRDGLDHADWLALPQQHLLQLTRGGVFRDDDGELTKLRTYVQWYPTDLWLWLIASQWHLIANTQPLSGRTLEVSDSRGARLLVYRLSRLIMEMAFLQERHYQPYDKWFGTAFAELEAAATLGPLIDGAFDQQPNATSDSPLSTALIALAERHTALGITEPVKPVMADFDVHINNAVRPYPVLNTQEFINVTIDAIADPARCAFEAADAEPVPAMPPNASAPAAIPAPCRKRRRVVPVVGSVSPGSGVGLTGSVTMEAPRVGAGICGPAAVDPRAPTPTPYESPRIDSWQDIDGYVQVESGWTGRPKRVVAHRRATRCHF